MDSKKGLEYGQQKSVEYRLDAFKTNGLNTSEQIVVSLVTLKVSPVWYNLLTSRGLNAHENIDTSSRAPLKNLDPFDLDPIRATFVPVP